MNEALVENSQDDVDNQDGHQQENAESLDGGTKYLGGADKVGIEGRRNAQVGEQFLHGVHGRAQRHSRREVEGDGDRRQLAKMIHC